jgi:hypothetical protein
LIVPVALPAEFHMLPGQVPSMRIGGGESAKRPRSPWADMCRVSEEPSASFLNPRSMSVPHLTLVAIHPCSPSKTVARTWRSLPGPSDGQCLRSEGISLTYPRHARSVFPPRPVCAHRRACAPGRCAECLIVCGSQKRVRIAPAGADGMRTSPRMRTRFGMRTPPIGVRPRLHSPPC